MSQKKAVYNAVTGYFADNSIEFTDNEVIARDVLSKEGRATVIQMLIEATRNGDVAVNGKSKTYDYNDDKQMKEYWSGTVTNWLTRDTRFNLGARHISDPTKGKSRDNQLKALSALLDQTTLAGGSEEDLKEIQVAIDSRKAEIAVSKKKDVEIDVSILPDHLKHLA